MRLLHPDGRELFLTAPAVGELERATVSFPTVAYSLMQSREALLNRASALSSLALLPLPGNTQTAELLKRRLWAQQTDQYVPLPVDTFIARVKHPGN